MAAGADGAAAGGGGAGGAAASRRRPASAIASRAISAHQHAADHGSHATSGAAAAPPAAPAGRSRRAPAAASSGTRGRRPRPPAPGCPARASSTSTASSPTLRWGASRAGPACRPRSCRAGLPRRARSPAASSASTAGRASNRRGPKQVCSPVWQAGPGRRARASAACRRRSRTRSTRTSIVLPEVAPFCHSSSRDREWKCARPVARVASSASCVRPGHHQHVAAAGVLDDAGDQLPPARASDPDRQAARRHLPLHLVRSCDVPSWKIDAASAAEAPASSAAAMSAGPPAPPEAITGTRDRAADRPQQLEVVAAHACRRCRCWSPAARRRRARPPRRPRPPRRGRSAGGRRWRRPASRRCRRAASIATTTHWLPNRVGQLGDQLGPVERRGVDADLVGAGQQQLAGLADPDETPPPTHSGTSTGSAARSTARSSAAPVLVAGRDVQPHDLVGALRGVALGRVDRVAAVAQRLEVDALHQPAAADVQAGDDRAYAASHALQHPRGRSAPLFSGWNWTPAEPAATHHASAPRGRRSRSRAATTPIGRRRTA